MHSRVLSSEISQYIGKEVYLQGWIHKIRNLGGVKFLLLRDRNGLSQIVVPKDVNCDGLANEWVVSVTGLCKEEPRASSGVEILASRIEVITKAQTPPVEIFNPEAVRKNRLETLFEHRAVSLRIPAITDIFRVQSVIIDAHGICPHGGMGTGLERLLKQILGLSNIKEACAFPRDRYRLLP